MASVEVDGEFTLRRIRIVKYPDNTISIFLPSRMKRDGGREDYFFCKTLDLKRQMFTRVFERLEAELTWRKQQDDLEMVKANKLSFFDRMEKVLSRGGEAV